MIDRRRFYILSVVSKRFILSISQIIDLTIQSEKLKQLQMMILYV